MGSALIKVRFENEVPQLLLSQDSLAQNARSVIGRRNEHSNIADFHIGGLQSGTEYFYGFSAQRGSSVETAGRFWTFPDGAASFRFIFASCAQTASEHEVFSTILRRDPLFFLHVGDLHYRNIDRNDRSLFQQAYSEVFGSNVQGALYANVPLIYVWDDHDFGTNNSDRFAPGRIASRLTYQECVPHYPLAFGTGDVPICHAFSVGRVRFVVTDLRSERSPAKSPDGPDKTMLGGAQKEWFKRELLSAKSSFALIFWVSSVPWTGESHTGDGWAAFSIERQEVANFIKTNCIRNLCILSGDAHMLGADDGRNGDFANDGGAPFPPLQAAPLDRPASFKGGPYSHGYLARATKRCINASSSCSAPRPSSRSQSSPDQPDSVQPLRMHPRLRLNRSSDSSNVATPRHTKIWSVGTIPLAARKIETTGGAFRTNGL